MVAGLKRFPGGGLILAGNVGSGKTHLSVSMMKYLYESAWNKYCDAGIEAVKNRQQPEHNFKHTSFFIETSELLLMIRESFRDGAKETEGRIIDRMTGYQLLVIDDLGTEKTTDFAINTLYILINRRGNNLKDTIITTNLNLQEIENKLNARIASRLSQWYLVNVNLPDYRKNK